MDHEEPRVPLIVVGVVMVMIIRSRCATAVQTGRAGCAVPARRSRRAGGAGAEHDRGGRATSRAVAALEAHAHRAAAAGRALPTGALRQVNPLILHGELVAKVGVRE